MIVVNRFATELLCASWFIDTHDIPILIGLENAFDLGVMIEAHGYNYYDSKKYRQVVLAVRKWDRDRLRGDCFFGWLVGDELFDS